MFVSSLIRYSVIFIMLSLVLVGVIYFVGVVFGQQDCGVQRYPPHTAPVNSRIVGGREAVPHSWPWQVILRFRDNPMTCGGSLIKINATGELVVLTSSQCVDGTLPFEWKVHVGVHSRSAMEQYQKLYDVSQIISHQHYNPFLLYNDIAIVMLTDPVEENYAVSPICVTSLPSSDFYGKQCVVSGWGSTVEGGQPADKLKEVYKPVLSDAECSAAVGGTYQPSTMICAGYIQGGQGACDGDNGGPLACKNVNGQYDLIGIVSWGFSCARVGYPTVYTDVHKFLGWISNNTMPTK